MRPARSGLPVEGGLDSNETLLSYYITLVGFKSLLHNIAVMAFGAVFFPGVP